MPAENPSRICKLCEQPKSIDQFYLDRGRPRAICKGCVLINQKQWRERNIEACRQRAKSYYGRNRGEIIRKVGEWGKVNSEKVRANKRRYEQRTKDRQIIRKTGWRAVNPEKMAAARARWKAEHPDYGKTWASLNPDKVNAYSNARRAKYIGTYSDDDVQALWKSQHGLCSGCKTDLMLGYHVDHIVPVAKGGTNWPDNLQLLCPPCNLRKGSKDPYDWARENGRLF